MVTKELKTVPKITVKIWRPLLVKLEQRIELTCLRRDAYLAQLLENELPLLEHEVSLSNSIAAHGFVAASVDNLDRKPVSLALPPSLVERLNDICSRKRIVRDAFFNRLFLLLAASPSLIDDLLFDGDPDEWKREVWRKYKHDDQSWQSEFYPLQPQSNPFWALREALEIYAQDLDVEDYSDPASGAVIRVQRTSSGDPEPIDSLYTRFFDKRFTNGDLSGLNCYVPDWRVPGHAAAAEHLRKQQELDALFAD